MLAGLSGLFAAGALAPLPVACWDVRRAPEAFRYLSQARHIGKVVLTIPAPPARRAGTVLVTGATGALGRLVARHLVAAHGRAAPGAGVPARAGRPGHGRAGRRAGRGWARSVRVAACDVADRDALAAAARGPGGAPLTGVVHAAGVLDDGVIGSLTPARVEAVLRPEGGRGVAPARADRRRWTWRCSCCSPRWPGCWAAPGRANYAAANAFLDALAAHRRGPRAAGDVAGVGAVGAGQRDGRAARRG